MPPNGSNHPRQQPSFAFPAGTHGTTGGAGQLRRGAAGAAAEYIASCPALIYLGKLTYLTYLAPVGQEGEDCFTEALPALHAGAVTGVDVAVRRPLAVTAGADRSLRLWNHADRCMGL